MKPSLCVLNRQMISEIYDTYMKKDFPPDELRPLEEFLERLDRGIYECLGLFDGEGKPTSDTLRAYGFFVKNEEEKTVLLDFLAVCPKFRDQGLGGRFLKASREYFCSYQGILIECESEMTAENEAELSVRSRRIGFYKKNGCVHTRTRAKLFGVDFDILYLPIQDEEKQEVKQQLCHMYELMFGEKTAESCSRVWNRTSRLEAVWRLEGSGVSLCQIQDQSLHSSVKPQPSLLAALGFSEIQTLPRIISFVGGGGKTTTMYELAEELAEQGYKVLVTTTTHIRIPQNGQTAEISHISELGNVTWENLILTAGMPVGNEKLAMPDGLGDETDMEMLLKIADVILIEADGAKRMPIKVPRDGEPVLIPQTGLVIAAAGLSAVGKRFGEVCFRLKEEGGWLRRQESDLVQEEDLALILMDERGSRKNLQGRMYRIVLNQADGDPELASASAVHAMLPVTMQEGCAVTTYGYARKSR